jgi:ATP-binding cassette subfamily C protein
MILLTFTRAYPWQSFLMVVALLLAGLAEGFGLSALLPLLTIVMQPDMPVDDQSELTRVVLGLLERFSISPTVGSLLIFVLVGVLIKNIFLLVANKQVGYTKARVTTDLRLRLLNAVMSSRWYYFVHQPVGRLTNSMATEAWRAGIAYEFGAGIIAYAIQTLVYLSVALMMSWQATVSALGAAMIFLWVSHFLVKMTRKAGKRQTYLLKSLLSRMTDILSSVKTLKAMGREDLAEHVLSTETAELNHALEREVFSKAALTAAQEPMFAGVAALAIFILLTRWEMPIAEVMVLTIILTRVLTYLGKLQKHYQKMVTAESAYWSLEEAVQEAIQLKEVYTGGPAPRLTSQIELDNVTFTHEEQKILDGVSLRIPAGELTTIIGRSGSGKTTILDLLAGLNKPDSGHVRVDGVALDTVNLRDWRKHIGYAPQDTALLHDTIFNNVSLGDPEMSEDDVRRALKQADAWDFVAAMPEGMQTNTGERGARVSAGQRQRIMLARALVHQPCLLILDEATSALDRESEAAICRTLKALRGDLTIVAVSHQPALAEFADAVYTLSDGRIAHAEADLQAPS